jgi:hypothetical protein
MTEADTGYCGMMTRVSSSLMADKAFQHKGSKGQMIEGDKRLSYFQAFDPLTICVEKPVISFWRP